PRDVVVHEQHAQLPRRHAGGAQRDVLGDGVILAVAEPGLERAAAAGKRRRPLVGRAPLRHVAGVADGVVDALVDEVEAHAALVRARLLHDRGETGGGGRAGGLVGKAAQERRLLRADVGGDEREETEGLVVSGAGPGVAAFAVRGIGRRRGIDRGEPDVALRLLRRAARVLRHHLVDGEEARGRRRRARGDQRRDCRGRGRGRRRRRRRRRRERGDDDRLRRRPALRRLDRCGKLRGNRDGFAGGDTGDDGHLVRGGRVRVDRRHGNEAEEQHNRQPLGNKTRPRRRTHGRHAVAGALNGASYAPPAPDLFTGLAIRPWPLRAG